MSLGYDRKLFVLAFDHRGSFQSEMFGIDGDPTPEQIERITAAKRVIWEGLEDAAGRGVESDAIGVLVDEQFGGSVPEEARREGTRLAMPCEKSGQAEFDFEYGSDFGAHLTEHHVDFAKVLVRFNPDGDEQTNNRQLGRLRELSDWLAERPMKFLFELLVPAEDHQLASVGGDADRYDRELRPELMRRAIQAIQQTGVVVDIWKIEGIDRRKDAEMLAHTTREPAGADGVACILLGRNAPRDQLDQWLRVAAPVPGFLGFAIGRSIWWDPIARYLEDGDARAASREIADRFLAYIDVYEAAA